MAGFQVAKTGRFWVANLKMGSGRVSGFFTLGYGRKPTKRHSVRRRSRHALCLLLRDALSRGSAHPPLTLRA
jgi:hypothetical protein